MESSWVGIVAFTAPLACAQTAPDAGRIFQDTRPAPERANASTLHTIKLLQTPQASSRSGDDVRVHVTQFDFTGNRAISEEVLRAAVGAWSGKSLNFGELMQVVEAVEALYKEAGYFLAQAYLPPQKIRDGNIEIAISEGRLGETRLEGESRVVSGVVYAYLDRLPKDQALELKTLERQVLLINDLAGGRTNLDLQAGERPDTTDVILVQQSESLISGRLEINNHGLPSTGEKRFGVTLFANSPFNLGERVSLNALTSEGGGLTSYNLRAELPLGGDGWRLLAGASRAEYSLGGEFSQLDASGTVDSLRVGAIYPLVRSRTKSLRIQFEADQNALSDTMRAANSQLDKQSRGITATVSADWMDEFAGGGTSRADLVLRAGQLDLGASAASLDAASGGPGSAGQFKKATLALQRLQTLGRASSLQVQLTWQIADKNLDSSEKFSLGGPTSIPGYAGGEASGDTGVHAKLGLRWQVAPNLMLAVFTDYAQLRLAQVPAPVATVNDKQLRDIGLSADWQWGSHLMGNAIAAWAENGSRRCWLNVGYQW
jgi:hemolysin activation/secretion protein